MLFAYSKKNFNRLLFVVGLLVGYVLYMSLQPKRRRYSLNIKNPMVKDKYDSLVQILGKPTYKEVTCSKDMKSATWMSPLHRFNGFGKFGGCDYIKILGEPSKKYHPHPANVFLIVGKYMFVPENLFGPLKYASETINIEQLLIPESYAMKYFQTGKKELALVTGSCGSITISAITVQFVKDMIEQYKDSNDCLDLYETFRSEYDKRIHNYLCGVGFDPIDWFDPSFFKEPNVYNIGEEKCSQYKGIQEGQYYKVEGYGNKEGYLSGGLSLNPAQVVEPQAEKKAA